MRNLSPKELQEQIDSFPFWYYSFDLSNDVVTRPRHEGQAQAVLNRRNFIWPAALNLFGGSLKGLRVLDIGCNAGFWCHEASKSGAEYVLGIDSNPAYIEQAQLVRDAMHIDSERVELKRMSVYDLTPDLVGKYDLVLLLRILYHLSDPMLALRKLRDVCRGYLIVDTQIVPHKWPILYVASHRPERDTCGEVPGDIRFVPSVAALELMLTKAGFIEPTLVPPTPPLERDYLEGRRAVYTGRAPDLSD